MGQTGLPPGTAAARMSDAPWSRVFSRDGCPFGFPAFILRLPLDPCAPAAVLLWSPTPPRQDGASRRVGREPARRACAAEEDA